jgi:cation-transporting ATPase I
MALLARIEAARSAAGAAARLAVTGAVLASVPAVATVGLLAGPTRAAARLARSAADGAVAVAGGSLHLARVAAETGTRTVGAVLTGSDPIPDGHVRHLADVARGMLEPPLARRTRRVWAQRGHVHIEVAAPSVEEQPEVRRALRRHLERLEGVEWATVNDVVGRVLVGIDDRRVSVEEVVGVVTAIEQARGAKQVFPLRQDHPGDLEPLLAAVVAAAVDLAAVGVAFAGKVLPVPAVTRHITLAIALLDSQQWLKDGLEKRIGPVGTDLAFTGTSALLHALTQSPSVPAINAAAALQQALEIRARRQVWLRREPELCRPEPEQDPGEAIDPPGSRPAPYPRGPIETYRARLGPTALGGAVGLLPLTWRPGRSADLLKALTPKAALLGRESFAAATDLLMCRRDVLPMDGSAYRRLDRVDTVVLDSSALCTGPPVVLDAAADADGWDTAGVWTAAARLLGGAAPRSGEKPDGNGARLRLGPPRGSPGTPGGEVRTLLQGRRRVGEVTVAAELDPHAEALVVAVTEAGHRLVLSPHVGTREIAGAADEVPPAGEPLVDTVRRLQAEGHGVLVVSATDGSALLAADVAVAPVLEGRAPAWGADLVTPPGLAEACRLVAATDLARAVSRRSVSTALTGNVLGALLAAVGSARYGQRKATAPGKTATTVAMLDGAWTAVRLNRRPEPPPSVHTPWHALDPDDVLRRLDDLPAETTTAEHPFLAPVRAVAALPLVRGPARFARTVAAELADPLTPILGTGAAATAMLGESTDAVLVGSVTVGNALISGVQRLRAETALESLLLEQDVCARREIDSGTEEVPGSALRLGDVLHVSAGDVVAADARLLEATDLEVDESNLTGESLAVSKSVPATPGADVADRSCMLFDGTTVVAGSGRAVVVAVGSGTEAGRAARAAGGAAPPAGVQARLGELTPGGAAAHPRRRRRGHPARRPLGSSAA